MNIKIISRIFIFLLLLLSGNRIYAEETNINLTIRNGDNIIYQNQILFPEEGEKELLGHTINKRSVLSILDDADILSEDFSISNLVYYDSFGSFYLKCITSTMGENCDNWQYVVNNIYPGISIDQKILSNNDSVYIYYGPQNKITVSSSSINTSDTLYVNAEEYNYEDNSWKVRTGVTIGVTQPNPDDAFSPIEKQTAPVNDLGVAIFGSISEAGTYNIGVKEDYYFPTEELTVLAIASSGGGGGTYYPPTPTIVPTNTTEEIKEKKFNTETALDFIISNQEENGSFGASLYTDWATLALSSATNQDINSYVKLTKYLSSTSTIGAMLTDYERHAMALMSLGLNPYNTNGENYIQKIIEYFDGNQFGDKEEDNDDIFALIVLQNAGFDQKNEMIIKSLEFILSRQREDGSWDYSTDMTGAVLQVLANNGGNEKFNEYIIKANNYLKEKQKSDGGWGNVSSTSWVIGGLNALKENLKDWQKDGKNPIDYLVLQQDEDGGVKGETLETDIKNRIWQTAYAVIAISGKSWNEIMQKFDRPIEEIVDEKVNEKLEEILTLLEKQKVTKVIANKKEIVKETIPVTSKLDSIKNTASVINAFENTNSKTNPPAKNWFMKILDIFINIF